MSSFPFLSECAGVLHVCTCVACVCAHARVHVSPESQNSIIVNISFDGASGSRCWPAALLSFGIELPTSGLCQHSPTACVCVRFCVCIGVPASAPELSAIGWGTDLWRLIKGVASIKGALCLQAAILKAWESSFAFWRMTGGRSQTVCRQASSPGEGFT